MRGIALVTGGAKGIGKAIVDRLASDGYDVVINYLTSKKEAEALKQMVEDNFGIYAGMVIQKRALVDVRDCLKPSA